MMKTIMDSIEEIQSKKRREAGLSAWAEMLERLHSRPPIQSVTDNSQDMSGGSGLPRDTLLRQNPKISEERKVQLQQIKADIARLQAEAKKLDDRVEIKQVQSQTPGPDHSTRSDTHTKISISASTSNNSPHTSKTGSMHHPSPALPGANIQESANIQEKTPTKAITTPSYADTSQLEQLTQLAEQSGLVNLEAEPQARPDSDDGSAIEEVLRLMQLKGGQGANPALAAKEYVLASQLPGVKDTLNGGVFEDYRVAL